MNPLSASQLQNGPAVADEQESGVVQDGSASRRRYLRILQASLSAVLSKGAVLLVNLISIPIVVRYLGPEQFGIWTTISTSLSLLLVLDFGIANTLINFISEAYARDDKRLAGIYSATAFWLVLAISVCLGIVAWFAWPFFPWDQIFHVSSQSRGLTSEAVAVAFVIFLIGMPAGLAAKLLGGYQELRAANLFAAFGSVGSLVGIVIAVRQHGTLPVLVGASSGGIILANVICMAWITLHHKPWLAPWPANFKLDVSRRLLHSGGEFFLIQLAGLIVFNSDNLVIAHFAGPAEVTPYNVTWRLVSYASALQTLTLPALWPAYTEAFVRGDIAWVKKTLRHTMVWSLCAAFLFCTICFSGGRFLIRHWAGMAAVPTQALLGWMCVWVLISTFMNNVACVLVAASRTRVQAWSSIIGSGVNVFLSIWWIHSIGVLGVILATVVSYLVFLVIPQVWDMLRILRRRPAYSENQL